METSGTLHLHDIKPTHTGRVTVSVNIGSQTNMWTLLLIRGNEPEQVKPKSQDPIGSLEIKVN